MAHAIVVERIEKRYGTRRALAGVSFSVAPGEIVGLLGPNGAGKSTTLSILGTILRADAGAVSVAGHTLPAEARAARASIGYVPQCEALYPPLTARENLSFFGAMLGIGRAALRADCARVLDVVGLADRADEPVERFSVGMRRRLNLACGILHRPPVLLLDEPTVGVDPQSRERLFDAVGSLARGGAAVLYSTHYMEEAERLCGRVVLLDEGRVVAVGTPAALIDDLRMAPSVRLRSAAPLADGWLSRVPTARLLRRTGDENEVQVEVRALGDVPAVILAAVESGAEVLDLRLRRPNLADVFFAMTGRALRDERAEPDGAA